MKKKVGLLLPSLNGGGAERVVSRLSHILADEYDIYLILFDASIIKYSYQGTLIDLKVPANNDGILSKVRLLIKRTLALKKVKKNENLNVVISFLDSPNIVNVLSKTVGCRIILSVRNYIDKEIETSKFLKIIGLFSKIIYNRADQIISVSKEISEFLNQKYSISESKLQVIYNPYDINEIEKLSEKAIEDEYKDFMSSGEIFVSVGRQTYQKGFWHLVKAFKLVNQNEPETKLVVIGRDENDGNIKDLIRSLGIDNNVLLTGFHNNPFKFIKNSHVYVMTSLFEGFPNALVEAMACGCPVISTDCSSGPKEILLKNFNLSTKVKKSTFGDYGVLVPPFEQGENWDSNFFEEEDYILAEAMVDLLRSKEKREYYSVKSIERARRFNYENCFYEFKDIIERLVKID